MTDTSSTTHYMQTHLRHDIYWYEHRERLWKINTKYRHLCSYGAGDTNPFGFINGEPIYGGTSK